MNNETTNIKNGLRLKKKHYIISSGPTRQMEYNAHSKDKTNLKLVFSFKIGLRYTKYMNLTMTKQIGRDVFVWLFVRESVMSQWLPHTPR